MEEANRAVRGAIPRPLTTVGPDVLWHLGLPASIWTATSVLVFLTCTAILGADPNARPFFQAPVALTPAATLAFLLVAFTAWNTRSRPTNPLASAWGLILLAGTATLVGLSFSDDYQRGPLPILVLSSLGSSFVLIFRNIRIHPLSAFSYRLAPVLMVLLPAIAVPIARDVEARALEPYARAAEAVHERLSAFDEHVARVESHTWDDLGSLSEAEIQRRLVPLRRLQEACCSGLLALPEDVSWDDLRQLGLLEDVEQHYQESTEALARLSTREDRPTLSEVSNLMQEGNQRGAWIRSSTLPSLSNVVATYYRLVSLTTQGLLYADSSFPPNTAEELEAIREAASATWEQQVRAIGSSLTDGWVTPALAIDAVPLDPPPWKTMLNTAMWQGIPASNIDALLTQEWSAIAAAPPSPGCDVDRDSGTLHHRLVSCTSFWLNGSGGAIEAVPRLHVRLVWADSRRSRPTELYYVVAAQPGKSGEMMRERFFNAMKTTAEEHGATFQGHFNNNQKLTSGFRLDWDGLVLVAPTNYRANVAAPSGGGDQRAYEIRVTR